MSDESRPVELAGHPVVVTLPVQWGDQDAFGHANNVVYFRWFESARIEYFRQLDQGLAATNEGLGPILASIKCDFRRQLTFPDTLLVSASVESIGRTSLKMVHRLYSTAQRAIAAEGDSVIVMYDYDNLKSVPVPAEMRAKIDGLEQRPGGNSK